MLSLAAHLPPSSAVPTAVDPEPNARTPFTQPAAPTTAFDTHPASPSARGRTTEIGKRPTCPLPEEVRPSKYPRHDIANLLKRALLSSPTDNAPKRVRLHGPNDSLDEQREANTVDGHRPTQNTDNPLSSGGSSSEQDLFGDGRLPDYLRQKSRSPSPDPTRTKRIPQTSAAARFGPQILEQIASEIKLMASAAPLVPMPIEALDSERHVDNSRLSSGQVRCYKEVMFKKQVYNLGLVCSQWNGALRNMYKEDYFIIGNRDVQRMSRKDRDPVTGLTPISRAIPTLRRFDRGDPLAHERFHPFNLTLQCSIKALSQFLFAIGMYGYGSPGRPLKIKKLTILHGHAPELTTVAGFQWFQEVIKNIQPNELHYEAYAGGVILTLASLDAIADRLRRPMTHSEIERDPGWDRVDPRPVPVKPAPGDPHPYPHEGTVTEQMKRMVYYQQWRGVEPKLGFPKVKPGDPNPFPEATPPVQYRKKPVRQFRPLARPGRIPADPKDVTLKGELAKGFQVTAYRMNQLEERHAAENDNPHEIRFSHFQDNIGADAALPDTRPVNKRRKRPVVAVNVGAALPPRKRQASDPKPWKELNAVAGMVLRLMLDNWRNNLVAFELAAAWQDLQWTLKQNIHSGSLKKFSYHYTPIPTDSEVRIFRAKFVGPRGIRLNVRQRRRRLQQGRQNRLQDDRLTRPLGVLKALDNICMWDFRAGEPKWRRRQMRKEDPVNYKTPERQVTIHWSVSCPYDMWVQQKNRPKFKGDAKRRTWQAAEAEQLQAIGNFILQQASEWKHPPRSLTREWTDREWFDQMIKAVTGPATKQQHVNPTVQGHLYSVGQDAYIVTPWILQHDNAVQRRAAYEIAALTRDEEEQTNDPEPQIRHRNYYAERMPMFLMEEGRDGRNEMLKALKQRYGSRKLWKNCSWPLRLDDYPDLTLDVDRPVV